MSSADDLAAEKGRMLEIEESLESIRRKIRTLRSQERELEHERKDLQEVIKANVSDRCRPKSFTRSTHKFYALIRTRSDRSMLPVADSETGWLQVQGSGISMVRGNQTNSLGWVQYAIIPRLSRGGYQLYSFR